VLEVVVDQQLPAVRLEPRTDVDVAADELGGVGQDGLVRVDGLVELLRRRAGDVQQQRRERGGARTAQTGRAGATRRSGRGVHGAPLKQWWSDAALNRISWE
jgi:hypothetical protein